MESPDGRRHGPPKNTIYILGGGMSGLSAAAELTRYPGWESLYRVVVIEQELHLGGKMASQRETFSPKHPQRVREHGVHILQGWYANTFRLMREVYENLHDYGDPLFPAPFATWLQALSRVDATVLSKRLSPEHWDHWTIGLPCDCEDPGQAPPDLFRRMARMLEAAWDLLARLDFTAHKDGPVLSVAAPQDELVRSLIFALGESQLIEFGASAVAALYGAGGAVDLLGKALGDPLDVLGPWLKSNKSKLFGTTDPASRCKWTPKQQRWIDRYHAFICIDLAKAILRGLTTRQKLPHSKKHLVWDMIGCKFDLEPLNQLDFRDFLETNKASRLTLESALVDFIYKGTFSNFTTVAAGTAIRFLLATAGYRGSFVWQFKLGTGDTMIMPLYLDLVKRGVEFLVDHPVTGLELDTANRLVTGVNVLRPANHPVPPLEYTRLVNTTSAEFRTWLPPYALSIPKTGIQLAEGDKIWVICAMPVKAVEALPLGERPHTSSVSPYYGNVSATITVSAQLWFDVDMKGLGLCTPILCGLAGSAANVVTDDPIMTSWTENTTVLPSEGWSVAPDKAVSTVIFSGAWDPSEPVPTEVDVGKYVMDETLPHMEEVFWKPDIEDHLLPRDNAGAPVLDPRYFIAANRPTDLYTLSEQWKQEKNPRLRTDESGCKNLFLAGDWIDFGMNAGYSEGAIISGMQAAQALLTQLGLPGPYQTIWSDMDLGPNFPCVCGPGCQCKPNPK